MNFDFDNMTPEMIEALDLTEKAHKLIENDAFDAAAQALAQAEDIEPMCIRIYIERGGLYALQDQYDEALAEYEKARLIDKNNAEVQYMMGNTYLLKAEFTNALEAYRKAEEYGYRSPFMVNNMGACCEQLHQLDNANAYYSEAARMQPDWIEPRMRQVNVLMIMQKHEEARSVAEKAVQDFPHNSQVYCALADVLVVMEELEEADRLLETAMTNVVDTKTIMIKQLNVWYFLDQFDRMQAQIAKLHEMELDDEEADIVDQAEGELDLRMEKPDEARAAYERVLSREKPDNIRVETRMVLMTIYKVMEDYANLRKLAVSSLNTPMADSLLCSGYAMEAIAVQGLKQEEEAQELFRRALMKYRVLSIRNRDRMDVHVYRIMCHIGLKEYDKAGEELDYVEQILGSSGMTQQLRVEILKGQGKDVEASELEAKLHQGEDDD